jgi:hypothetical protein
MTLLPQAKAQAVVIHHPRVARVQKVRQAAQVLLAVVPYLLLATTPEGREAQPREDLLAVMLVTYLHLILSIRLTEQALL